VECLVDIADLGLEYIKEHEDGIEIGAATTVHAIEVSASFSFEPYVVLRDAARALGTPRSGTWLQLEEIFVTHPRQQTFRLL